MSDKPRLLFRVVRHRNGGYVSYRCNLCGDDIASRRSAVWHAKGHGSAVRVIADNVSSDPVEDRYEIVNTFAGVPHPGDEE